jgi:hypothetical protein
LVVVRVTTAVDGVEPFSVIPGGFHVQVVDCGNEATGSQPSRTTWSKPWMGVTVTVYEAACPEETVRRVGVTASEKS